MNVIYFTLVAALLYLFSDWVLQYAETAMGRRFQHRSLLFFLILATLAVTIFSLISHVTGNA